MQSPQSDLTPWTLTLMSLLLNSVLLVQTVSCDEFSGCTHAHPHIVIFGRMHPRLQICQNSTTSASAYFAFKLNFRHLKDFFLFLFGNLHCLKALLAIYHQK